jgi:NADPH-dependent 2,4-dienoyl-CoA reductase/sulfur reductase-like enzyme
VSGRLVIVGGGPAGLAVARAFREAGGEGPVLMLSADDRPPYERPALTKELLRGEVDEHQLPIEPPAWYADHGVEIRCGAAVRSIDPERRRVALDDGEEIEFRDCALCTGSEAIVPPIPGADGPRVHRIRTARDGLTLARRFRPGLRVAVVGSGFIGCEAAASLAVRGAAVTMLTPESAPQGERMGEEVGEILAGWLRDLGVGVSTGVEVTAIENRDDGLALSLDGGSRVAADIAVIGTGARPLTRLAEEAGAGLHEGGVPTDAAMHTGVPGLWCAGDPACALNAAAGRRLRVEHWGEAQNQGAVAGRTIAGADAAWATAPGFWSSIASRTIKQVAWGDGWDEVRLEGGPEGFTARYGREGRLVGVLTHERDQDYERGRTLVEGGAPLR